MGKFLFHQSERSEDSGFLFPLLEILRFVQNDGVIDAVFG